MFPGQGARPRTIWVAAAPKTASTLLSMRLQHVLSWRTFWLMPRVFWRQPQQLQRNKEFEQYTGNVLIPQTHTMFNEHSNSWIERYDMDVVIPTRSILDSLISASDHSKSEAGLPFGYLPDSIKDMAPQDRLSYIIGTATGWYTQFYTSWHCAATQGKRVHFVSYDHMVNKPEDSLKQLLTDLHITRTDEEITAAVKYASNDVTRFNVGGDRFADASSLNQKLFASIVKAVCHNKTSAEALKGLL